MGRIVIILALFTGLTLAKTVSSAEEIFQKSIKLFSMPNISFIVDSTIKTDSCTEKRSFFLAKTSKSTQEYDLLIRFMAPSDIKCTAVLIINKNEKVKRYAYFPSLDRVRIIPNKDQNKEVFGMGISYNELSNIIGEFISTTNITEKHKTFHKLVLENKNVQTNYYINQKNNLLEKIETFKNNKLIKKVTVLETLNYQGEPIVKKWSVEDFAQHKHIDFNIQKESLTKQVNNKLFSKNRLQRCSVSHL